MVKRLTLLDLAVCIVPNVVLGVYAHGILSLDGPLVLAAYVVQCAFGWQCGVELAHWHIRRDRMKQ